MKRYRSALLFISFLLFLPSISIAKEEILILKPITVTASRIYSGSSHKTHRSVDRDYSLRLDNSLVDSRTRGPKGVQDDISMRGAPFEETLVLLNGIRMNDPQTGHFTMDIPLTRLDIDRLDIVYGPSSAYYGSSGIGGTINILAKPPEEKPAIDIELEGGQHDYYSGAISINMPVSVLKNKISFEASRSGGYRAETEFDKIIMNANSNLTFENGYIDFMFGYLRKDFGADSFYSQFYENEEEHTDTTLFKLDANYRIDEIVFRPVFYYRRHWDKFILDRNRPDWYKNFHKNYLYGGEFDVIMKSPLGDLSYGIDLTREEIDSTSLGDHSRDKLAIFFENRTDFEKWFLDTSARIDYYSSFGWEFNPNLGIGIFINPEFKLRASAARSFRAPTFTDLYYVSPANVGNPDLSPEKAWSFDLGVDYIKDGIFIGATSFVRFTSNMIDWTRTGSSEVWYARNIGEFDVYGIEIIFRAEPHKLFDIPNLKKLQLKYGYIEDFNKENVTSKYVLNYLMHNLNIELAYETIFGIMQNWEFALKKRIGDDHYFLLNTRIYKDIKIHNWKAQVFLEGENLLDTDYKENGSVPMPGMWITGGIRMDF
ncbi:MAG: TonB-dependent receptor [Candidatus Omnitrophica bacterium]|nr:TonB-dependent receptor [Candidatus Omnitrophota bacterium]